MLPRWSSALYSAKAFVKVLNGLIRSNFRGGGRAEREVTSEPDNARDG